MSRQVAEARRFYLEPAAVGRAGLAVVSGGWERCAPDYEIRRSGFPQVTLEFVAGGRGSLQLGGRVHPLLRGAVFAYGPGIRHTISTDPVDRLSKYFVNFSGRGATAAIAEAGLVLGECHHVAAVDDVQAAFEQLLYAGRRGTRTAARIATLQGQILLLLVSEVRLPSASRSNPALATFLRCQRFIEEHFLTLQTAEQAAAACHVAPAYLSRLFLRFAGQPPYRFLMRLKMHHAAMLLEERRLMVRQAADVFGLDPFQFSRAFKRVHGLSPLAFIRSRSAG